MKFLVLILLLLSPVCYAQHDHAEIAAKNAPAVVAINVAKNNGATFTGTGFVVTPDGVIATSRHVTDDALFMNITFNNGAISGEAVPLAQGSGTQDLALLKIQAKNLPYVTIGNSDYVVPGQEITVIGNPRRLQNTVTSGLISQVRQQPDGSVLHQISAPISPSSSGSPVFNDKAEVISIAFGSYEGDGNQNLNFSVPSNYLRKLISSQGIMLPRVAPKEAQQPSANALINHINRSWLILKSLLAKVKTWWDKQHAAVSAPAKK
jgi:S1-C subfamily serine protease